MINKNLRKKIAYLILFIFLPIYIIIAVSIINYIGRLNIWVEFITYVLLGVLWIFPFKFVFKGLASR